MRIYTQTPFLMVPPRGVVVSPDCDRPAPRPPEPDMEDLKRRLLAAMVEEVNRMLGQWVSECEPVIVFRDGLQQGLAHAGDPENRVLVRSRLDTMEACVAALG